MKVTSFEELGAMHQRKLDKKALPFGTVTNSEGISTALKTRPLFEKRENVHVKVGVMTVMESNIPLRAN